MDRSLSKGAQVSLSTIYRAYLKRIDSGMKKIGAMYFYAQPTNGESINDKVKGDLRELSAKGFVTVDKFGSFTLTDKGINYMEKS